MSTYIWRKINVGFWKESTRGTSVAIASWTPKTTLSLQDKSEAINDESSIWVISDTTNSYVSKQWSEGSIEWNVNANNFWYALLSAFGEVTSAETTGTGAYNHDFTLAQTNNHQTLSIGTDDPVDGDRTIAWAMLESLSVSAEVGGFVTFTAEYKGKKSASATHTVNYTTDYTLLARHCGVKFADTLAGLDSASNVCVQSFSLTISKNLEEDLCLSSVEPLDYTNKQFTVEGSATLKYTSEEYKNLYMDSQEQAMRFTMEDTNTVIGVSDSPALIFEAPKVKINEFNKNMGNDDVVTQELTLKAFYDTATAKHLTATLINTLTSY